MNRRSRLGTSALLVALGLLSGVFVPAGPAQADPLGVIEGEALDVAAEHLDVDVEKGTALLTGEVRAQLGELEVRCDKVEIRYDQSPKVQWARGTGGVVAKLKGIEARAAEVEVDVAKRAVTLEGGVRLMRGKGWVTAHRATIDVETRKVSLSSVKGSIPVVPRR